MAAEQAKDRGNRAFAAANYREAVACFSEAIALHERSGEGQPHVYYSNRSASHLKLGDGASALADADKCVALKRDWARGYSRKGAALHHLGRLPDAYRAYQDGLKIEPANAALREGLQAVQTLMASSAQRAASASAAAAAATSTMPSASAVANKSLGQFVAGDKTALFQSAQFAMRSVLLLAFVSYWLPLLLPSALAFGLFFKVALFNHASFLVFTHGVPKWQAAYAQRLVLDPTSQALFYCLVFFVSAPYGLAMVPVWLLEMVHWVAYLGNLLVVLRVADSPLVAALTTKALLPLTAAIISEPALPSLPTQSKWAKVYHRMPQVAATVEVAIGLAIAFELLTPARNFLLVMLYWQLLRVRYMISPPLQDAFRRLNASILSITSHPRCPPVVGRLYSKIRSFATSMTDVAQQQQAAAGSRCSVM
ncbi:hypothetical protein ATCC90586_001012 [Pythium insidiosum]|nr:hypothetical protein ATCC90586_001012 [Pythium insidiosum]